MNLPQLTAEQSELLAAIRDLIEIEEAMLTQDGLEERHHQAFCRVEELVQRIPSPAQSPIDAFLRVEVAWAFADKDDGVLRALGEDAAAVDRAMAEAIAAVREIAGIRY
jgi:hypothetical protein